MTDEDKSRSGPLTRRFMFSTAAAVVGVWLIYGIVAARWPNGQRAGVFGDTFGALNTLFSGLAMLGVLFAVIMQHQELEIAKRERKESEQSRKESEQALARQAELSLASARIVAANSISNVRSNIIEHVYNAGRSKDGAFRPVDSEFVNEMRKNIQYMEILLNDISNPDFVWGELTPIKSRTPIRKYIVNLAREARRRSILPQSFGRRDIDSGINHLRALQLELERIQIQDSATEQEITLSGRFAEWAARIEKEALIKNKELSEKDVLEQKNLMAQDKASGAKDEQAHERRKEETRQARKVLIDHYRSEVDELINYLEHEALG